MSAHGTRGAYVSGCRCEECRRANREYMAALSRRRAYGTWESTRVPAQDVRAHVDWLRTNGMGMRVIAEQSGVARSTLSGLYRSARTGQMKAYVSRETADRVLAVDCLPASGVRVDGLGTARRLQALVAIGWCQAELARRLGWQRSNFWRLMLDCPVRASTAEAVRDLYEQLWDQQPPASTRSERTAITKARRHAARQGWVPPLAWDDDSIDDPTAEPAGVAKRKRTLEDVLEDFEDTRDHHNGNIVIAAERLGVQVAALQQAFHRARRAGIHVEFHQDHSRWAS